MANLADMYDRLQTARSFLVDAERSHRNVSSRWYKALKATRGNLAAAKKTSPAVFEEFRLSEKRLKRLNNIIEKLLEV